MSKLLLINEINTTVKMVTASHDEMKLTRYLDELLTNYHIKMKDKEMERDDNEDYIHMYLSARVVENYSKHTLMNYRYELERFAQFLNKSLLKATTGDIRTYLARDKRIKESTMVTKLERLSAFYNWLVIEEELLKNPCSKIKRPKLPKKVRNGLTVIEMEMIRAACVKENKSGKFEDLRKRALIEVMYSTACRLDELYRLNRDDIDWSTNSVIVFGKGSKERRVYLSEKAQHHLKLYLENRPDDCEALFVTERQPIKRLEHAGIQNQIKVIARRANLNRPVHCHIFRHTFAQQALDNGMPIEDLQAYLGHEKSDTTARYASVSEERKRVSFTRFHQQ